MEEVAEGREQQRLIIENFLTTEECKELEFIHKSCCAVGYRPSVFSTTLFHLVGTNCAHLIMPLVPIRERLKEKAEEFFGFEYELFVEFTGLISWSRGASIGWHSDDNRPYLKQRHFAAVCYLNNYGVDFKGRLFHFQDGEPTTVTPSCGDCVMYSAGSNNVHSVDEITEGERVTLTLWFTRDSSHDEDAKLISLLSKIPSHDHFLPLRPEVPSGDMYWFSLQEDPKFQSGFNIWWARLHALGYDIFCIRDYVLHSYSSLVKRPLPVLLARGNKFYYGVEFDSILHALQVVLFHCWKPRKVKGLDFAKYSGFAEALSSWELEMVRDCKYTLAKKVRLARKMFLHGSHDGKGKQHWLGWASVAAAAADWEDYVTKLRKDLMDSLPHWTANQSIFSVSVL